MSEGIYDVAIIGSGPSGNATANSLLSSKASILWIEESSVDKNYVPFSVEDIANRYRYGGTEIVLGRPPILVSQPLAIDGGLAINAGFFQRPTEKIFKSWNLDSPEWDFKLVEQECLKIESDLKILARTNGAEDLTYLMKKASEKLGWLGNEVAFSELSQRRNYGHQNRTGLLKNRGQFISGWQVEKLKKEGGNWSIQSFSRNGSKVYRAKNVFLCAGAIQTPRLLMRSHLIPRYIDGFKFHPSVKVVAEFPEEFISGESRVSSFQVKEWSPDITIGSSVTSRELIWAEHIKSGVFELDVLKKWKSQALFYCSTEASPKTKMLKIPGFSRPLMFSLESFPGPKMKQGLYALTQFAFAMGAKKVYLGGQVVTDEQQVATVLSRTRISPTALHLFSSLPMGQADRNPVDLRGKLKGQENIYVVDGSILPSSPGVNPQETIMAMARRIANQFVQTTF